MDKIGLLEVDDNTIKLLVSYKFVGIIWRW
jgi:hypothetical protein